MPDALQQISLGRAHLQVHDRLDQLRRYTHEIRQLQAGLRPVRGQHHPRLPGNKKVLKDFLNTLLTLNLFCR